MSTDYLKQQFETKRMAAKGVSTTAILAVIMYIVTAVQSGEWNPTDDITQTIAIMGGAAVAGALVALRNWLKNYCGFDISAWFGVLLIALCLQGCATAGLPGTLSKPVKHETWLKTQAAPTVNELGQVIPGESYDYHKTWQGGAGVDAQNSDSLSIGINAAGDWHIDQGANSNLSTQGQMSGIIEASKVSAQLISQQMEQLMQAISLGMQLAAPLVGQKMDLGAIQKQTDSANDAAFQQGLLNALQNPEVLKTIRQIAQPPRVKPVTSPVVDPLPLVPLPTE